MENTYTGAEAATLPAGIQARERINLWSQVPSGERVQELMAPGHLYNPRTRTGIEWLPPNLETGAPGRVRLWSRQWNGEPVVLAEAEHHTDSTWEYWYSLHFASSFPQVTHWWFGDAWTGIVRIWQPEGVGRDPESGAPMLSGWMRFGSAETAEMDGALAFPWTVVLTNPPRASTPLPPMSTNLANLPLQLLLAEGVMEMLHALTDSDAYQNKDENHAAPSGVSVAITSLVRREDLHTAFPAEFNAWRLDRLPDLTPREALCRVQGIEPVL